MIYYSPYQTTIGKTINTTELEASVKQFALTDEQFINIDNENKTIYFYPNSVINKFDHPFIVELTPHNIKYVACNMSAFTKIDQVGNVTVVNRSLYSLQAVRSVLTSNLLENGSRYIKSLHHSITKIYSDLITNAITITFNVNAEDIIIIRVLSGWLYYSLLTDQKVIGDLELQAMIAKLSRDINIPSGYISQYINGVVYNSVTDFIEDVKSKIDNISLQNLNLAMFYSTVSKNLNSTSWVGLDKQEIMAISIEHIPSFIALIVICLSEQSFRHTGLTRIATLNIGRDAKSFLLGIKSIVNID